MNPAEDPMITLQLSEFCKAARRATASAMAVLIVSTDLKDGKSYVVQVSDVDEKLKMSPKETYKNITYYLLAAAQAQLDQVGLKVKVYNREGREFEFGSLEIEKML